jgi:hypothetical protein
MDEWCQELVVWQPEGNKQFQERPAYCIKTKLTEEGVVLHHIQ